MPNWCENKLTVSGEPGNLKRFINKGIDVKTGNWSIGAYVQTPPELLQTIAPSPALKGNKYINFHEVKYAKRMKGKEVEVPELILCLNNTPKKCKALVKKYGYSNWYNWNLANLGVKWDCIVQEGAYETDNETYFSASFQSHGASPTNWLKKVQAQFPTLKFKLVYMESGCWFAGVAYTGADFNGDDDTYIENEDDEPYYEDGEGNVVTYDSKKEAFIKGDGTEIPEDDFYDNGGGDRNPFENYKAWWED